MAGLDSEIRAALEESIDNFLEDAEGSEKIISIILEAQGIEPNLETLLSFIVGNAWGLMIAFYTTRYQRGMNDDESKDFIQVMKRRAWELRQAFIGTRIEE